MARFIFKLAGVLEQRLHEEQTRRRDLALRQAHLAELEQSLRQLSGRAQAANEYLRKNHLVGRVDMSYLAAHRRFLVAMQRGRLEIMQRMAIAQTQVAEALAAIAESAKRRKAVEKLREKQFERWKSERERREITELDEVALHSVHRPMP
jgi:flagellar protein FliJ